MERVQEQGSTGPQVPVVPILQPVEVPKPAVMLADVLRARILQGDFPEGQALPPERVLVEQSHLSRAAVREALGILKQQGLVITRPGRNGGTVVTRPSAADLLSSLEVYIQAQGWHPQTPALKEIREMVEPWCAGLAATRATPADLATVRERLDAMRDVVDDVSGYVAASLDWHFSVADASRNVLLSALMRARSQEVVIAADHARYDNLDDRRSTVETHEEITRALEARDARAAYELMRSHVCVGSRPLLEELEQEAARVRL